MQAMLDMDVGDQEAMIHAIALSLSQPGWDAGGEGQAQGASTSTVEAEKKTAKKKEEDEESAEEAPLDVAIIDNFTESMMTGAMRMTSRAS